MDYNQLELNRETLFKDAVLNAADSKSMDIIAEAQRKSNEVLAKAKLLCEEADHELISSALKRDGDREHSAALAEARRGLLARRQELVEELFGEVEARLADFAKSKDYPAWLAGKAKKAAEGLKGDALTVHIRPADEGQAAALEKALPGCTLAPDASIVLGGVKVTDGKVQYDETLDEALRAEKERFYANSRLFV